MVIKNKNVEVLDQEMLEGVDTLCLTGCIIEKIDLIGLFSIEVNIIIEDCIINHLQIHSCWFVNGLTLKNSIVKNYVDYQMGGHNEKRINITGNIFNEFFNFFDCQFDNIIQIENNIFVKGTNILGHKGEGFENTFKAGYIIKGNAGEIDLDEVA